MEPFGILQFLQSILPQTRTETAPQSEQPAESAAPETDGKPQENAPQTGGSQEAIVRFMQAHENRAKRTKRQ